MRGARLAAAAIVATIAFWAYTQTLLPGVDLGDTGGFQAAVLWPAVSARQAYPLYYTLAKPFVATLSAAHPARGLNLFSAVWGAVTVGLLTWVVAEIGGATLAGVGAGLLFAFSFTFWTQAIIAEVYTLHLALTGVCLLALVAYAAHPSRTRLAVFFTVFAIAFGNHLSMILLLVPCAVFLIMASRRPRDMFRPAVIVMAVAIAIAAALQYTPNFLAVWSGYNAPPAWSDRLAAFWFDVTKADWRESMVLGIPRNQVADRLAMWGWDARQQFGIAGLLIAAAGAVRAWTISRRWAVFLWLAYGITTLFAITYNVGDSHVFYLPSHYFTALFAGLAVVPARSHGRIRSAALFSFILPMAIIAYAGWRAWDTWPAVDRHTDRRGEALVAGLASGVDDQSSVLVSDMDWQSENALLYSSRWERRNIAWLRLAEVLPHFPFFVRNNHEIDRDLLLTPTAAASVVAAYGDAFSLEPIDAPDSRSLTRAVAAIPRGAPYVLTLLTPSREDPLDPADFDAALAALTGAAASAPSISGYQVFAGVAGERPGYRRNSEHPFRERISVAGDRFDIRMESWLPDDTFRRAGFGQVIRGHDQVLIVERGVSLVWFSASGDPHVVYAAGLYAPKPRFRISRATLHLAALPGH